MKVTATAVIVAAFAALARAQGSYYVDASEGSDSNPGTSTLPWLTLKAVSDYGYDVSAL